MPGMMDRIDCGMLVVAGGRWLVVGGLASCAPSYKSGRLIGLVPRVGSLNPASRSEVVVYGCGCGCGRGCVCSFMCVDRNVRLGGATTLCLTDRRYLNGPEVTSVSNPVMIDYVDNSERCSKHLRVCWIHTKHV